MVGWLLFLLFSCLSVCWCCCLVGWLGRGWGGGIFLVFDVVVVLGRGVFRTGICWVCCSSGINGTLCMCVYGGGGGGLHGGLAAFIRHSDSLKTVHRVGVDCGVVEMAPVHRPYCCCCSWDGCVVHLLSVFRPMTSCCLTDTQLCQLMVI